MSTAGTELREVVEKTKKAIAEKAKKWDAENAQKDVDKAIVDKAKKRRDWKFYVESEDLDCEGHWARISSHNNTADAKKWIKDAKLEDGAHVRSIIVTHDVVVSVKQVDERTYKAAAE